MAARCSEVEDREPAPGLPYRPSWPQGSFANALIGVTAKSGSAWAVDYCFRDPRHEQIHSTELGILQHVATRLITAHGTEALYDQILDTALVILHADLASIQMIHADPENKGKLKLLGHRSY